MPLDPLDALRRSAAEAAQRPSERAEPVRITENKSQTLLRRFEARRQEARARAAAEASRRPRFTPAQRSAEIEAIGALEREQMALANIAVIGVPEAREQGAYPPAGWSRYTLGERERQIDRSRNGHH